MLKCLFLFPFSSIISYFALLFFKIKFMATISENYEELADSLLSAGVGANFFEEEVDEVLFHTNNFLSDPTFVGSGGPFNMILTTSLILAALFSIIYGSGMAYKMMYKGEPFDPLKILKVVAVAVIMSTWYSSGGILDMLSVIPNSIGSWTKSLYDIEVEHVQGKFETLSKSMVQKNFLVNSVAGTNDAVKTATTEGGGTGDTPLDATATVDGGKKAGQAAYHSNAAGIICLIDKIFFLLGIVMYRIGFWGTIFAQQICLGMLTIFGPFQWAFSLLPKWEGAWAKWIIRYLTVHFYGAMLYFVGFYVLLMYDIVFSIQIDQIAYIIADNGAKIAGYIKVAFFTSVYMLVAGAVSWKCLNLVPDLAAWMIPEGETAYSTRGFAEGIAGAVRDGAKIKI